MGYKIVGWTILSVIVVFFLILGYPFLHYKDTKITKTIKLSHSFSAIYAENDVVNLYLTKDDNSTIMSHRESLKNQLVLKMEQIYDSDVDIQYKKDFHIYIAKSAYEKGRIWCFRNFIKINGKEYRIVLHIEN